jgi:hypothetical protein
MNGHSRQDGIYPGREVMRLSQFIRGYATP